MKMLYFGAPVPETPEFLVPGFYRAGNLAARGIAEGLYAADPTVSIWGFKTVQSFPRYKQLFVGYQKITFPSGMMVRLLPYVNILFLRELLQAVLCAGVTVLWSLKHLFEKRCVILYNLYRPPIPFQYLACRLSWCRMVPIVFDIGMPPCSFGKLRDGIYKVSEFLIKCTLNHSDGVAVIVENIVPRYCKNTPWLLVDGGVSPEIRDRLFDLKRESSDDGIVRFVFAGSLAKHNGLSLLLEAMERNRNQKIRLTIAGTGEEEAKARIVDAASKDTRIKYVGMLNLEQLFAYYKESDCILNLRLTKEMDTSTWFPSKFLEAMVVGRCVLSTNVAHLKSVYGKHCVILDDEDANSLSKILDEICAMGRTKRDEMGAAAREMMLAEHTWNAQMKRLVTFCRELK